MIRLEQLRFNAGLSPKELAEETGVDRKTIERIEQGKTTPRASTAKTLADYFHTDEQPVTALDLLATVEPVTAAA